MEYTTLEQASGDAQAMIGLVAVTIPVETFVLYTIVTLRED
jgi:hypothetical protein